MPYEECSECGHSTEYKIADEQLMELLCYYPISIAIEDGKEMWEDCSECIKQGKHCVDHGSWTIDSDICECCGQED